MAHQINEPDRDELHPGDFGTISQFISSVGRSNEPVAVMLTCWELADAPNHIAHAHTDNIMVVQNSAGIVPATSQYESDSATAAICYALGFSTVRLLIVCGHRDCRMVPMLLSDRRPKLLPEFRGILSTIREDVNSIDRSVGIRQHREYAVQQVILHQLRNLKSHSTVRERVLDGDLLLHGWLYDDTRLTIMPYNPYTNDFRM